MPKFAYRPNVVEAIWNESGQYYQVSRMPVSGGMGRLSKDEFDKLFTPVATIKDMKGNDVAVGDTIIVGVAEPRFLAIGKVTKISGQTISILRSKKTWQGERQVTTVLQKRRDFLRLEKPRAE